MNTAPPSPCGQHTEATNFSAARRLEVAQVFKALGHPTRLKIVEMLLSGERCVCELQEASERNMSTISAHLQQLRQSGVIVSEQRGKWVMCRIASPCLAPLLACFYSRNDT